MDTLKADISEIFSSIQGEAIFLGARQIFVRFNRCNLNCSYCDEPKGIKAVEYSPSDLMSKVLELEKSKGPHHSVSLTGGEPLLYTPFLKKFLGLLKKSGLKSYLETNGTLPDELKEIIGMTDIVAMDFKLPSSTGESKFWKEHLEFLRIASEKKVFVKVVITPKTVDQDVERAMELIKKVNENIPLILQPATPLSPFDRAVDNNKLLGFLDMASKNRLDNIRVIPQIHKILKVK